MDSTKVSLSHDRKGSKSAKGEAAVFEDAGRLKINLPRQFFGGKQIKKALGLKATPENYGLAEQIAKRITLALQANQFKEDSFDLILAEYGLKKSLKLVTATDGLPPKPSVGTWEIWQDYLQYKKPTLKESTYLRGFSKTYSYAVKQAIEAVGDDANKIRSWLLSNRSLAVAKEVISNLTHAYRLALKQGLVYSNPFEGMAAELAKVKPKSKVNIHDEQECDDTDLYNAEQVRKKAYTQAEVKAILDYVYNEPKRRHFYPVLNFLFLTGCRTAEAAGFMYGDIKWEKEYIVIQRSYCPETKNFITTKTGHIRLFPMPKDGNLWNLLKAMGAGNPGEVVFKNKRDGILNIGGLGRFWRGRKNQGSPGVIPALIQQGKVSKYLKLYNTRHTFISYQINECGIPPHVVKDWCGHSEKMTTVVYRQEDLITKPGEYGKSRSQPTQEMDSHQSQLQALEQQNFMLAQQLQALQELVANLQPQLPSLP